MTPLLNSTTQKVEALSAAGSRANARCLVVHDDLDIAAEARRAGAQAHAKLDADTLGASALDNLSIDQLRSYAAVLLIVEFMPATARAIRSRRGAPAWAHAAAAGIRVRTPRR